MDFSLSEDQLAFQNAAKIFAKKSLKGTNEIMRLIITRALIGGKK